jgi:hypothetical protein
MEERVEKLEKDLQRQKNLASLYATRVRSLNAKVEALEELISAPPPAAQQPDGAPPVSARALAAQDLPRDNQGRFTTPAVPRTTRKTKTKAKKEEEAVPATPWACNIM